MDGQFEKEFSRGMMESDLDTMEEVELYEKLMASQKDELDIEFKKIIALVRQLVATENKIDRLKKEIRKE